MEEEQKVTGTGEMGDPDLMWSDNHHKVVEIAGKKVSFFCDSSCILCTMCSNIAPSNFTLSDSGDHDICFKQPENKEEMEECYSALLNCPVGAIGDNGFDREDEMVKSLPLGQRFAPAKYSEDGKLVKPSMKSSGERENLGATRKSLFLRLKRWLL
tara:strand:+ start:6364 stop:6831 length:468 start_codon:yes stop_codon:yes gene_type:complete